MSSLLINTLAAIAEQHLISWSCDGLSFLVWEAWSDGSAGWKSVATIQQMREWLGY